MPPITQKSIINQRNLTSHMLHELNIPVHRLGYRQLRIGIPYYAQNSSMHITKELYPYIARQMGSSNWRAVEHSIRTAILEAWNHRNREVWNQYFPYCERVPSNKMFIAFLAEYLE